MTDSLRVVATLPLDPAGAAQAGPALAALAAKSLEVEEGCLAYEVFESSGTPGTFVTIETWRAAADLDGHMSAPHVAEAFGVLGPLLVGDIAIHQLNPVG